MNLSPDAHGSLVEYEGQSFFQPDPLPPGNFVDAYESGQYAALESKVREAVTALEDYQSALDAPSEPDRISDLLGMYDAVGNANIEGADIRFVDVLQADESGLSVDSRKGIREGTNTLRASRETTTLVRGGGITETTLGRIHEILMDCVAPEHAHPGRYRDKPIAVGRPGDAFIPPHPTEVDRHMGQLLEYVQSCGETSEASPPVLPVQAALVHYQFETIHPYGDGNGRLGRLLSTVQLSTADLLDAAQIPMSVAILETRQDYYKRLRAANVDGEILGWVRYFCDALEPAGLIGKQLTNALHDVSKSNEASSNDWAKPIVQHEIDIPQW